VIEFLPPREDAFGDRDGAAFVGLDGDDDTAWGDEPPRSRWATLIAGVTVFGLLTAGVVAAAPWRDDADERDSAPPTTLVAPVAPTTAPADGGRAGSLGVTTEPIDPSITGWLIDPPVAGQRLVSLVDPGDDVARFDPGWAEVWASPGATRASGRWLSISLQPNGFREDAPDAAFDRLEAGAFPVDVGGRASRASIGHDGVVALAVPFSATDGRHLLTIDAGGITLPALIEVASSITIDDRRPGADDDRPVLTAPELLQGMELVVSDETGFDLVDGVLLGPSPGGGAFYVGPDRRDVTLVRERPVGSVDPRLAALAFAPGLDGESWAFFDGFVPDEYAVGERDIDGIDVRVVHFTTGESDVWLVTTLSAGVLPAMLDDVRRVSAPEWAAAHDEALQAPGFVDLGRDDPPIAIGGGTLPDGTTWSATVSAERGDLELVAGGEGIRPRPLTSLIGVDRGGALGTVAVDGAMVVVAASSVEGAELRVSWADGTTLRAPLTEPIASDEPPTEPGRLDESFWSSWEGTRMTAVFAEAATPGSPFAAEIVAPDGTVLARFEPWSLGDAG
jgi:hypothetical protein